MTAVAGTPAPCRDASEDAAATRDSLIVVADGVGSAPTPAIAARAAVDSACRRWGDSADLLRNLLGGVAAAVAQGEGDPAMATTVAIARSAGRTVDNRRQRIDVVWAGDSAVWVVFPGAAVARRLTTPHARRGALTRWVDAVMTGSDLAHLQVVVPSGAVIVATSDGVTCPAHVMANIVRDSVGSPRRAHRIAVGIVSASAPYADDATTAVAVVP